MDPRQKKLSEVLVNYSCSVKKGEKVWIDQMCDDCEPLVREIIKEVYKAGGIPFVHVTTPEIEHELLKGMTEEEIKIKAELAAKEMEMMDCYIGIRANENSYINSNIPAEKTNMQKKLFFHPVHHEIRVKKTKWVILRYPNNSMAQDACMNTEDFEDFYYKVCTLDYSKMAHAMESLVNLMNRTDKVRIIAKDTDISFSIKDIPARPCSGLRNIPDGEVYSAPVKNSVNGVIHYNTTSPNCGTIFEDVRLEFKDGKIINATSNNTEHLNQILDTDEGSRYIGEFAIGVNPYVLKPMKDILFDEKICGSIHFTPGSCYDEADNGNYSSVHWDLVQIQTPEYGGGEIYFDNVLIRKDGMFVIDELKCLNPENLV